jgi:hypothetical protein
MSNRTPKGLQIDTIYRGLPFVEESFDLDRLDNFVTGLGVEYLHYKCMPSPIGLKDRGDYRRSDGVDTITSNGMIYKLAGKFTGTMTDNSRDKKRGEAGTLDPSESRLVLPRFYNKNDVSDGDRIYFAPGDRIYVADPLADVLVSNTQRMDYEANIDNTPMFPIVKLELPILDSLNSEYAEGVDYSITNCGSIHWLAGGRNPGIDPQTGKGRVYSIRYLYKAYWYVTTLLKELRITNVTKNGQRAPDRMAYHVMVMREYMFGQTNKGDKTNQLKTKDKARTVQEPTQIIESAKSVISVDMSAIDSDEEQS